MTADIVAPAHWRAIDFISDLHLSASHPATVAAWRSHLLHTEADAVFMLGDLFELWVGDDAMAQPFEAACSATMRGAARQRQLAFLVGNRDFLLGSRMAAASGVQLLEEPVCLQAFGQRTLLCHGDALCVADVEYQAFRSMVRGADWQRDFLARPLAQRLAIAADIRGQSEARKRFDGAVWADADAALATAWLSQADAQVLVHGHTHRPGTHALPDGRIRHVLSDWDLDAAPPRAEVLRWSARGFERLAPADAAA